MKLYLKIAIVVVAFVVGFFLGRKTIDVEEKIEYVKCETIRDTIVISQPTFVEIPAKPKYIYKYDTLIIDKVSVMIYGISTAAMELFALHIKLKNNPEGSASGGVRLPALTN